MGLLEWISGVVGRDLDRRVAGRDASAQGRYAGLVDDEPLLVRARLGDGLHGTLVLRAPGREERGEGTLSADLGPGRALRGSTLSIDSE